MAKKEETCNIKPCLLKGILLPTVAVFILISAYQYLFHGILMKPHYEATSALWRSAEEMALHLDFSYLMTALISLVLVMLYCCHTKTKECGGKCSVTGIKFGISVGLLLGLWDMQSYAWLPLETMTIPVAWLFGTVVMGLFVGLLLSWLKSCLCKS
ncbi:MAG: hypothetical protein P8P30_08770 [Rickettsiales bacterium]|nr:hypothetical protein [Rickettsiales bacterium]